MPAEHTKELNLFYCYARRDKALRDELDIHLALLKRQYHIRSWHDQEIIPGQAWPQAIDQHLNNAHLILLLISPDFMASDYCYRKEMARALKRHAAGTCRVIPILIRPTDWEDAPFSTIQMLPTDAKPVTTWLNHDAAWWDVTQGIRRSVRELLLLLKTKEEWLEEGNTFHDLKQYEEALAACNQAIRLDPNYALAYHNKGSTLNELQRFEEALAAFDQAIRLDPNDAWAYLNKGNALHGLRWFEEALAAYDYAIRLDPNYALAYYNKGNTFTQLNRSREAQECYQKARQLGYGQ